MSRFDEIDDEALKGMSQVAAEALAPPFQYLTWRYPEFKIGDTVVTNSKWIALTDESAVGFVCFKDKPKRLIGEHTVPVIGSTKQLLPNTFKNEEEWELVEKGRDGPWRKDPWEPRSKLPLFSIESKKVVVFNGESPATRPAIARLFKDFKKTRRRPLVVLTTIPREDKPDVLDPFFEIVEHTEHSDEIMGISLARDIDERIIKTAAPAKAGEPLPARNNDMDDEIPF